MPDRFYAFYVHLKWPLTGRADKLRIIEAAMSDRDSSGIVIGGAAGVGKSRLAREALNAAASHGRGCRWALATSSARALPLGAFTPWTSSSTDNLLLAGGVIESLTSAPRGTSVIVAVDDVHTSPPRRCARRSRATPKPMTCALTKSNLGRANGYSEKNY